jgi:ADP-ribose pyrophosphatase YjhB (NUDIX family)
VTTQPIGSFIVVVNSQNQILLGKRKNSFGPGQFGCPGGRLELTETLQDCAKRELLEETGLSARTVKYLGVIRTLQDSGNFIHFAFLCDDYEGQIELKEPDKCEEWNFYQPTDIPSNTLPAHLAGIDLLNGTKTNFIDLLK